MYVPIWLWRHLKGLHIDNKDHIGMIPHDAPTCYPEEELQTLGINYTDKNGNPLRTYGTYEGIISENGLLIENFGIVRISYKGGYSIEELMGE